MLKINEQNEKLHLNFEACAIVCNEMHSMLCGSTKTVLENFLVVSKQ